MARALADRLGWSLSAKPSGKAEGYYLSAYFEGQLFGTWPGVPTAGYFTHREEEPPGSSKARVFDAMAAKVTLRVATCRIYADMLRVQGPTMQAAAPLERERFVIRTRPPGRRPVVGLSGYTYSNHRKGEDLVAGMLAAPIGGQVEWRASGRGWPAPMATKRYPWAQMPEFYQGLDVLVCPSRVEGIPMPPLEALACGIRVVIPENVGLLDELGHCAGVFRYKRGNLAGLLAALEQACALEPVDPEALRALTDPYSVEAWCRDVGAAVEGMTEETMDRGRSTVQTAELPAMLQEALQVTELAVKECKVGADIHQVVSSPDAAKVAGSRGIYCVAFGDWARRTATRLIKSIKRHMPDVPVCLAGAEPLGLEDLFVQQPDSDIGGRRAKLKAYDLAPQEWQSVLYLDADTEVTAPIYQYFEWVEDGWEMVICTDPSDTLHPFSKRASKEEMAAIERSVGTLHVQQLNGGAWAFRRSERVAAFFRRWEAEWDRFGQRDQGALIRALYAEPLKIWLLGNEWNTFEQHCRGIKTAGLMHRPGEARRWDGMIRGRIDSEEAWGQVRSFEQRGGERK